MKKNSMTLKKANSTRQLTSRGLAALLVGFFVVVSAAPAEEVRLFSLRDVRLLEGPFQHAQDLNRQVLLQYDPDRLLAPFRSEAGLKPKAAIYGNWEASGLGGHTAGHYLTALAQLVAATSDEEAKRRLDTMVSELAVCQQANGDGYLGGVPNGRKLWQEIAAGKIEAENFSLNGRWVPWYNLHKLFAGLRDAWAVGGNQEARGVLLKLADWCDRLVAGLTDDQVQSMLRAEHGGMNEVFADIFAATKEEKYLALARRFSHRRILEPLLKRQDQLTGLHANTQIPKVIGYARIGELSGDSEWVDAARFFWQTVATHRSVAMGGNSVREHFHPADDFSSMVESNQGPETCNTYNMLRLTEQLFRSAPAAEYADFYERALYNHILSSQHPQHGGYVYMTPMRPRHYRVYSQPEECFWCCVGSGMENHTKYGQFIYAGTAEDLYVNLFIASRLRWAERGLTLRQETEFPDTSRSDLHVSLERATDFTLHVRWPRWVALGELKISVNGEPWPTDGKPSSYVLLRRRWQNGDRVAIEIPMRTVLERLPDGSDYCAVLHGPIVLAAMTGSQELEGLIADDSRMGHVASGPFLPLDQAPMLIGDMESLPRKFKPVPGRPLTFTAAEAIRPESFKDLQLRPFFRLHDGRYMIYWRVVQPQEYAEVAARIKRQEEERLALGARTLDQVQPGEQQSEVEHTFQGEESSIGVHRGRRFRQARGWFSYDLKVTSQESVELLVTYFGSDRDRRFDILVNGRILEKVELNGRQPNTFVDVTYPIPKELSAAAQSGILRVKFAAHEGSIAGGIYGLRLMKRGGNH